MSGPDVDCTQFHWAGGIEDTFVPHALPGMRPLEEYELTQHYEQWRGDLDRAKSLGITKLRWGVPWHRVEPQPGVFDWSWTDEVLNYMINMLNIDPILDLVHYGTPLWLDGSFDDDRYPERVAFFAKAVAERYGHMVRWYTALNEPTVNSEFAGSKGEWPPYLTGDRGYVRVLLQISRGIQTTICAIREVQPDAVFVAVESMHLYRALSPSSVHESEIAFLKDVLCWDLVRGAVGNQHPLREWLKDNGVTDEELRVLSENGVEQDIFGVNYYPWSARDVYVDRQGGVHWTGGPDDGSYLSDVLRRTYAYVRKPLFITETSSAGSDVNRGVWINKTLRAVRAVRREGVPVIGYTYFPLFTMIEWDYRTSNRSIEEHLLHLGLWDSSFNADGVLVRQRTSLVKDFRTWVSKSVKQYSRNH